MDSSVWAWQSGKGESDEHGSMVVLASFSGNSSLLWEKEGSFSIRSAYHIISDGGVHRNFHDHIWRPKSPLKVKFLAWRISHGRLPTRDRPWPLRSDKTVWWLILHATLLML
ncbi:hypothetical protein Taro_012087 [Colocasia esculenta]|uniref:Reverse transcriptase zinc-binding domain-containing protein n=1 Tax=Colocasia esculenta TaxID=4460 RepID=A0A843U7T5_COLES|nr:hypothetical protein [Colocasia esculenta]